MQLQQRAVFSGLQPFASLQAPTLARPPGCTHRRQHEGSPGGRAVYTTHTPGRLPARGVVSLRVRIGQLTRLDFHQLGCSLVGRSSRLRAPLRPGASHPPLGARQLDHALEPRATLSPAPPGGSRGGLPGRSTTRRRPPVPASGRAAPARGAVSRCDTCRSRAGAPGAARGAGAPHPRTDGEPRVARRAPGRGLGDRRHAPLGGIDAMAQAWGIAEGTATWASASRMRWPSASGQTCDALGGEGKGTITPSGPLPEPASPESRSVEDGRHRSQGALDATPLTAHPRRSRLRTHVDAVGGTGRTEDDASRGP